MAKSFDAQLQPTEFLDYESNAVRDFVHAALGRDIRRDPVDKAVALYYAVRDNIFYEVYGTDISRQGMRASSVLGAGLGFCVHKSILYAATLRSVGIPSRLYYADVRNHLASPRLRELAGGDVFCFHALTLVHLNDKWLKATPVFNGMLCKLYRIKPLDFDGRTDSIYHPYDEDGRRHMEFLNVHGEFDDFPHDLVVPGIRKAHPRLFASSGSAAAGSLISEASMQDGEGGKNPLYPRRDGPSGYLVQLGSRPARAAAG